MGDYSDDFKTSHPDRYEILKENSRANRKKLTPSEAVIWDRIRAKALGVNFRRQHPIGDYIADFFCYKLKMIIEIDGKYHEKSEQAKEDTIRENDLKRWGYTVLRFTNKEVLETPETVIKTIKSAIAPHRG